MASSASGQDEPNRALWLATRAGKMEPSCPLGNTRCIPQAKFHQEPYNKYFIDQVCSVKMAGYWPRSLSASLWTSTSSWSERDWNPRSPDFKFPEHSATLSRLCFNDYIRLNTHICIVCFAYVALKRMKQALFELGSIIGRLRIDVLKDLKCY